MKLSTIAIFVFSFALLLPISLLPETGCAAQVTETLYLQHTATLSATPPERNKTINLPETFTDGSLSSGSAELSTEVQGSVVLRVCTYGIIRPDVDFSITLLKNDTPVGNTVITVEQDGCWFPAKNYADFSIGLTEAITADDAISLSIEPSSWGTRKLLIQQDEPEANSLTFVVDTPSPGKKVVIAPIISLLLLNGDKQ